MNLVGHHARSSAAPAGSILLLDLGNTRLHGAVARGGRLSGRCACPATLEPADRTRILRAARDARAGEVWIAGVQPRVLAALASFLRAEGRDVRRAGRELLPSLRLRVRRPAEVGWDRVANAQAGHALAGGAAVCVDAGTALTVDAVTSRGEFLGGAIAPGLGSMARALERDCAALPLVPLRPTRRGVGRETSEALRAGIVLGAAGMVDRLIAEARRRLDEPCRVFLTGGDRGLLASGLATPVTKVADLTLRGLLRFLPASGRGLAARRRLR